VVSTPSRMEIVRSVKPAIRLSWVTMIPDLPRFLISSPRSRTTWVPRVVSEAPAPASSGRAWACTSLQMAVVVQSVGWSS
jgi:hypothetical protein